MNLSKKMLLPLALLISTGGAPGATLIAQERVEVEASEPSLHQQLAQALIELHAILQNGYQVPQELSSLIELIDQAQLEDIVSALLISIELLMQDDQLPEQIKTDCRCAAELIEELHSAMHESQDATRGGIFKEIPSLLVGVLRVVNALRVSGTLYLNPPAGTTALRVNGDSIFNGTTEFFGDVTITGTTTAETIIAADLSLTPSPAPQPTTDGQIFVSNGSAPAPNAGDLYYVLPLAQGGGVINLVASSGSGTVTQLNSGNGIVLTPDPITTTGTIATNATSANNPNTIISRDGSGNFAAGTASLENLELPNTTTTVGQITKNSVLFIHNFGTNNTFSGVSSGNLTLTGARNTGNGVNTLTSLTSGNDNTGVGNNALDQVSSGASNTALGSGALGSLSTGNLNTAIGFESLTLNTASGNTALGASSLRNNTTGASNTALGTQAMNSNTTGSFNTAVGLNSLFSNTTGARNTAIGWQSSALTTTATDITAVGYNSLLSNTTGTSNTAVGSFALSSSQSGSDNTAVGASSLRQNSIGTRNSALGFESARFNTEGVDITAIGYRALRNNSTGTANTAVGSLALFANVASSNTAVGSNALRNNTTGANNSAVGGSALQNNLTGSSNTAVGESALLNNTAGNFNTALGRLALTVNTTGIGNVAIGSNTLFANTNNANTALGASALQFLATGSLNTALGNSAGSSYTGGESNNILINNNGTLGDSGVIRIGTSGTQTSCFISGIRGATTGVADAIPVLIDSAGQLGTISSSRRYKDNISPMDPSVADKILALNPVEFNYKSKPVTQRECGLIAEEVEQLLPELVVHNAEGEVETVRYHILPVMLLHVIKSQQEAMIRQEERINKLEEQIQVIKQ